jgi:hypothetical protein
MPNITMTFPNVNASVQVGDLVYYQTSSGVITQMGDCTAVTGTTVSCFISGTTTRPTSNEFVLFGKNNTSNTSALRGYFAKVKMTNDETTTCELYTVGSEVFESSK